jgi:hypothetical protein
MSKDLQGVTAVTASGVAERAGNNVGRGIGKLVHVR